MLTRMSPVATLNRPAARGRSGRVAGASGSPIVRFGYQPLRHEWTPAAPCYSTRPSPSSRWAPGRTPRYTTRSQLRRGHQGSGGPAKLIAGVDAGKLTVKDPLAYRRFLAHGE